MNWLDEKVGVVCEDDICVRVKRQKRILYFSDGTMEEDSSEDDGTNPTVEVRHNNIDENKMQWGPWIVYKLYETGNRLFVSAESIGGSLANFIGISSPKYSYELSQAEKMKEEHKALAKKDIESASWLNGTDTVHSISVSQNIITKESQIKKY